MIVVIFEVQIKPGKTQDYLDWAEKLKNVVQQMPGFIGMQRFQSLSSSQTLLSVSHWQHEQGLQTWKQHDLHQQAQEQGKSMLFERYKIHITQVLRQYEA